MSHYSKLTYEQGPVAFERPAPPPSLSSEELTEANIRRWVESVERTQAARKAAGLPDLAPMEILRGLGLVSPRADVVVAVIEGRLDL